ncbi:MAG: hypothetical protein FIA99_16300 [Ruminiclostridium sp.]|nr:hypothetical protein [Ruminiclostridium sp.]
MLRKDFFQILEYATERYRGKIALSTNGTLINEENAKVLAKYCYHIDTINYFLFSYTRRGAFLRGDASLKLI